jgi:hypothetical protein
VLEDSFDPIEMPTPVEEEGQTDDPADMQMDEPGAQEMAMDTNSRAHGGAPVHAPGRFKAAGGKMPYSSAACAAQEASARVRAAASEVPRLPGGYCVEDLVDSDTEDEPAERPHPTMHLRFSSEVLQGSDDDDH